MDPPTQLSCQCKSDALSGLYPLVTEASESCGGLVVTVPCMLLNEILRTIAVLVVSPERPDDSWTDGLFC